MSTTQPHLYCSPFDSVADQYDQVFTDSHIGRAQRASVWSEIEKVFRPGDNVLEIGCGTGVDACFLASRGVAVVACDSSSGMIDKTSRRVMDCGLGALVQPRHVAAAEISSLSSNVLFDGVFSNFGALNCVEDLRSLALDMANLMKPGARALLCLMGPHCAWEIAWYLGHGDLGKAFRRMRRAGTAGRLAEDVSVHVNYPSMRELARTFSPAFRLKSVKGIGVSVPPSYVGPWVTQSRTWLEYCVWADSLLGYCPGIRTFADHILLGFERENHD